MAKVKKKTVTKGRKKKWLKIVAPKAFNNTELGESFVYEPQQLLGKTLKVNLMTLTRDPKQQNIKVQFKVSKLDGDRGIAELSGFETVAASLKRIVRRGKCRIDTSFTCKTKDKVIRIKPIILTRSNTHKPVLSSIRKEAEKKIKKICANYTFDALVKDLLGYRIQKGLRSELSKLYPIKSVDIRTITEETAKKKRKFKDEPVVEEAKESNQTQEEKIVKKAENKSEENTDKEQEAEDNDESEKSDEEPVDETEEKTESDADKEETDEKKKDE